MRSRASQKLGTEMPSWLTPMTATSPRWLWRAAANMPSVIAIVTESAIASSASGTVISSRAASSSSTGTL